MVQLCAICRHGSEEKVAHQLITEPCQYGTVIFTSLIIFQKTRGKKVGGSISFGNINKIHRIICCLKQM